MIRDFRRDGARDRRLNPYTCPMRHVMRSNRTSTRRSDQCRGAGAMRDGRTSGRLAQLAESSPRFYRSTTVVF
jgi:hypothetical protein